jgi:hypothetical protein
MGVSFARVMAGSRHGGLDASLKRAWRRSLLAVHTLGPGRCRTGLSGAQATGRGGLCGGGTTSNNADMGRVVRPVGEAAKAPEAQEGATLAILATLAGGQVVI